MHALRFQFVALALAVGMTLCGCEVAPAPDGPGEGFADALHTDGAGPGLDSYIPPGSDVTTAPPDASLGKQPLGGVCTTDTGCVDGACNIAYPGGYCTTWCDVTKDCPLGGKCLKDPETGQRMCWKMCSDPLGCRLDQFCPSGAWICTPKCQDGGCQNGYLCDPVSGQCVPPGQVNCEPEPEICDGIDNDCDKTVDEGCGPGVSESDVVLVEDLGRVQVGGGGLSRTLYTEVSPADTSFTILVLDHDPHDEITAVYSLRAPSGELLVNGTDPYDSPIRAYPGIGTVAVQVPNTPSVVISPGLHTFTLYREGDPGYVWVYVLHSVLPDPTYSAMDVNYWFVGTPGYTASNAANKQKFKALHNTFKQILEGHGVLIDKVSYYDVMGANAQKYTYVDTSSVGYEVDEHAELLTLSGVLPKTNRGVNFFFVQGFNGWGLLGKAGGIPGPPLKHGTYNSGVVVSFIDMYDYPTNIGVPVTAEAMAHELGHQLGLFHTSEQTGEHHDPIADTPQCTSDWNQDGVVDVYECEGKGSDNLMFWSVSLSAKLSAGQKHVIHRNASMF